MDTIFIYKCLWFWGAFFICKMKTCSRLAEFFQSFGSRVLHVKLCVPLFPQPVHSHLSLVSPNVVIYFYSRRSSWISAWPQESYWEQRAGGEATEAGGGWGGSSATPVLCCRLGPTWTDDANTPWGTGKELGPAEPGNYFTSTWPKETLFLVPSHSHLLLLCFDGVNKRKIIVPSDSSNSCLPQLEKSGL